jgi:hypothetical protein
LLRTESQKLFAKEQFDGDVVVTSGESLTKEFPDFLPYNSLFQAVLATMKSPLWVP